MRRDITATILAISALCLACPSDPIPGDDEVGETTSPGDSTTDTTDDADTGPESTDDATEGDTTETGPAPDMPSELAWYVYDEHDVKIGRLATPDASVFNLESDDMFDGVDPSIDRAHLLDADGFGFYVNQFVPFFVQVAHDDVMFTGSGCTGTAVDHFASQSDTDVPLAAENCDDATIEMLMDNLQLHYGLQGDASGFVELNWPGALGLVVNRNAVAITHGYHLALDQGWPEVVGIASTLTGWDASCTETPSIDVCGIVMEPIPGWQQPGRGPYHLMQE